MTLACHSCSTGDSAQNVTKYRQFAFADTTQHVECWRRNAEFGFIILPNTVVLSRFAQSLRMNMSGTQGTSAISGNEDATLMGRRRLREIFHRTEIFSRNPTRSPTLFSSESQ